MRSSLVIRFKPLVLSIHFAVMAMGAGMATIAHAQMSVSIAAGDLNQALNQYALQHNVNLILDGQSLAAYQTTGLQGSYSIEDGFNQLLAQTPFQIQKVTNGYTLVAKTAATKTQVRDMGQLKPIDVSAQGRINTNSNGVNQLPVITVNAENETAISYTKKQASTSTRLDIDVKETPQSVSVVTRKQIEDMGVTNLGQALLNTTGIILTGDNTERTNFSIRGFNVGDGWNSNLMQYDGVAINANNVTSSKPDVATIESIEVLRGAAGLMQGSGEPSGAINIIRKKPTAEFQANGAISYGTWDTKRAEFDISGPLNKAGSVRGRLVVAGQDADSYMTAVTRDSNVLYGIVSADLTDHTLLNAGYSRQGEHAVPVNTIPNYVNGVKIGIDNSNCGCHYTDFWDKSNSQGFIDLSHKFTNGWEIKASYMKARYNMDMVFTSLGLSSTSTSADNALATVYKYGYNYQQDIDVYDFFAKGTYSLFGREHELVFGGNQSKSKTPGAWTSWDQVLEDYSLLGWNETSNTPYLYVNIKNYSPYQLPYIAPRYVNTSYEEVKQSGYYLTTRLNITDPFKVIAGVRQSNFESVGDYKKTGVLTPYLGLTYDFNDIFTGYASYTDTFVVQSAKGRNQELLDPIQGNVYEIGVKAGLFDDSAIASLAAFKTNQINRSMRDENSKGECPFNGGEAYCNVASGKVISEGIEAEIRGEVFPYLNLTFGYTYNTTEYAKDQNNQGRVFTEDTPEHIARLFATYKFANDLTVGGGVNYQSKWTVGRYESIAYSQPAYALVNLMASYPINEHLNIAVNVNNLFDKSYYSQIYSDGGVRFGEPINAMVTLRAKY
ncbi:TonB-dependent siderophore receptor [Acinetobacter puyangensis]|uniref:Iron complex outermembrane recepter protein/outer-membrane receptor for ferric coprogen and ferric-rhodotorulic acid n=1 Tax=Acinetobacter puyangensis TaxID=1096779 RepID=A0A240EA32_9GAMM|nr:TonB-dependent receptor [Acinetobacter puyangensis]SNX45578.1 iron complex outermembrane recepter protein/outer-membrane receptor for ferric coprogen and ferric-rhodotorulic acid [Acinetobacter puyangensis]